MVVLAQDSLERGLEGVDQLSPGQGEGAAPRSCWFWKMSGASGQGVCMCVHVCGCVCSGFTHPGLSPPGSQLNLINQSRPFLCLDSLSDSCGLWLEVQARLSRAGAPAPGHRRCWHSRHDSRCLFGFALSPVSRGFACLLASLPAPGTAPGTAPVQEAACRPLWPDLSGPVHACATVGTGLGAEGGRPEPLMGPRCPD